ncbi:predicted protein [Lichtheimia corymbifera JMRC:FSU:9682]|uniref:Uncharacterized protein n=1 Tax=Lichtheimia corymbifera JMRC:FSU:9682 TaxID=1263082 RepID=A0A068RND3_9FUNG|nr:predicted protein [Lichtheimia corymbifera JMRC:FSU:9682]
MKKKEAAIICLFSTNILDLMDGCNRGGDENPRTLPWFLVTLPTRRMDHEGVSEDDEGLDDIVQRACFFDETGSTFVDDRRYWNSGVKANSGFFQNLDDDDQDDRNQGYYGSLLLYMFRPYQFTFFLIMFT